MSRTSISRKKFVYTDLQGSPLPNMSFGDQTKCWDIAYNYVVSLGKDVEPMLFSR